jgi:hypothetical protein
VSDTSKLLYISYISSVLVLVGGRRVYLMQYLFLPYFLPSTLLSLPDLCPYSFPYRLLLYLYFEDALKRRYASFVEALAECSKDNLEHVKEKALKTAYELLARKAEAEAPLLSLLVNKLGDPNRKIASKTGYFMLCLLTVSARGYSQTQWRVFKSLGAYSIVTALTSIRLELLVALPVEFAQQRPS